jgi:hypothetical protein
MKTTKLFLLVGLTVTMLGLSMASCEKEAAIPTIISNEKKGGGNNPNTPNYNPCANYVIYPSEYPASTDWNISVDTTTCGFVIIRWDNQPGFIAYNDSCNAVHGKYFVNITPRATSCAGSAVTTNAFYYQLGSGCSMWPNNTYTVNLTWVKRDTVAQKNIWYTSTAKTFVTGTRATFLGTCQ